MAEPRFVAVGELTRVRAFTRRDVDRWLAWPRHTDALYAIYDPLPMDGSLRDAWYDDLVDRQGQLPFAIETYDRQMIGRLFLRQVRRSEGSSVLGIDLDPSFLGCGHGTDALRAFLGYYFGSAGFSRLLLSVAAYNVRAQRSYRRCGFYQRATHWETWQIDADVLGDPRYAALRAVFRRGERGVEALMYDMVAEKPSEVTGDSPALWRGRRGAQAPEAALGGPAC